MLEVDNKYSHKNMLFLLFFIVFGSIFFAMYMKDEGNNIIGSIDRD
jgi:hypothetical protein